MGHTRENVFIVWGGGDKFRFIVRSDGEIPLGSFDLRKQIPPKRRRRESIGPFAV
jgi:hypothetical protein